MRVSAYRPESRPSRINRQSSSFGTAWARATSTLATRKTVERLCTSSPGASYGAPASAQMSASPLASTTTRGRTRRTPLFVAISTDATRPSSTLDAERERMQQQRHACLAGELVPHALQRLRVVRDARAGAVGVRSLERHAALGQPSDDLVRDARDDLVRRRSRRVEGVEGVEHGGRRAAEEAEAVDEQRAGAAPRRRDGRRRPGRACSDHEHVDVVAHLCKSMHQ